MDHQPSSTWLGDGPTTPRRQLQGRRPPRLNIRKESHAIKKPPASRPSPAQAQGRWLSPVIKYVETHRSKVIHAKVKPSDFRAVVQRLTGRGPSSKILPPGATPELLLSPSAAMSQAARLATIERSVRAIPEPPRGTLAAVVGPVPRGILTPPPSSLPPAAASGDFSLSPFLRAASTVGARCRSGASRGPGDSDPFVPSPGPGYLLATPITEFFVGLPDFSPLPFDTNYFSFQANKILTFSSRSLQIKFMHL